MLVSSFGHIRSESLLEYALTIVILTISILLGTVYVIFSLFALGMLVLLIALKSEKYNLCILFYIMSIASIFKASPASTSFFTYIELVFVGWHLLRQKWKVSRLEFGAIAFTGYLIVGQCLAAKFDILATIKLIANVLILIIAMEKQWEEDRHRLLGSYVLGVAASSLIALFGTLYLPISNFVSTKSQRVGIEVVSRFSGLYADPNYFSVNLIIALCIVVLLHNQKRIKPIWAVLFGGFFVLLCSLTSSKSALLMLVIPLLTFISLNIRTRSYFRLALAFMLVLGVSVLLKDAVPVFETTLERISFSMKEGSFTTGRSDIWCSYLEYFMQHPLQIPIGRSIAVGLLDGRAAHNTYLDLIYQLGVIGTVLFLWIIGSAVVKPPQHLRKHNFANYSVLLVVIVMYFFLSELQYFDPPFHLVLAAIVLNTNFVKQNGLPSCSSNVQRNLLTCNVDSRGI